MADWGGGVCVRCTAGAGNGWPRDAQ